jgi:hypothetical protein
VAPLGRVVSGFGNNGADGGEGADCGNAFGTYLHGSLLPKNPRFADHLIEKALRRLHEGFELTPLDDRVEEAAHAAAVRLATRRDHLRVGGSYSLWLSLQATGLWRSTGRRSSVALAQTLAQRPAARGCRRHRRAIWWLDYRPDGIPPPYDAVRLWRCRRAVPAGAKSRRRGAWRQTSCC